MKTTGSKTFCFDRTIHLTYFANYREHSQINIGPSLLKSGAQEDDGSFTSSGDEESLLQVIVDKDDPFTIYSDLNKIAEG
jgi:hypothetical protein